MIETFELKIGSNQGARECPRGSTNEPDLARSERSARWASRVRMADSVVALPSACERVAFASFSALLVLLL